MKRCGIKIDRGLSVLSLGEKLSSLKQALTLVLHIILAVVGVLKLRWLLLSLIIRVIQALLLHLEHKLLEVF